MASSKKVRGLLIEIGGDTTKLQTALKDVDKTTASLSKELKGINTLLKFDPSNTTLLNQKTKVLSESIEETEKRLSALQQAQEKLDSSGIDKNSAEYRDLQREIESTTQKLSKLKTESSNWTKAGQALENFGNKIYSVGSVIDSVGNKLTMGLTLPIVALGTYAVKAAIDYESAFAGVRKTVDATEEEFQEFSDGIIAMSKELPSSATEIAAVAEAAGQLGIQNDALLSFTRTMIDLGEATNLTSDEAATQLARFANITQMSQQNFDKLGSSVVALGNNFATTEAEIVAMALRLAGAGKQVNMSEAEILGFAAALSSVGIEAEAGGSAFSKVMLRIESDIATNSDYLKEWAKVADMSIDEFVNLWKNDAAQALSVFIQGLSTLESRGENAIVMLSDLGLSEVRVRDSLLRASNASSVFTSALETSTNAWNENVALTNEAEQRYKTTQSQIDIAKNRFDALAMSLADGLLPHINDLLGFLGDLADDFANMSEEEQEAILKNIALVAAIGPFVKIAGTLTKGIGKVTKGLGTFSKSIVLAKNGIGDATGSAATLAKVIQSLISPIGLLVTAIGGALAIGAIASNYMTEEEQQIKDLSDEIKKQTEARKELAKERQIELESSLREVDNVERLTHELSNLVDVNGKVKEGYEGRVDFILGELNNAMGTEYKVVDGIIEKYDELSDSIDLLIAKKKASIILESQEGDYEDAIKNIDEYTSKLTEAQQKVTEAQESYNAALKEYESSAGLPERDRFLLKESLDRNKESLDTATEGLKSAQANYNSAINAINTYETNSLRIQSDNIEDYKDIIETTTRVIDENGKISSKLFTQELQNQITQTKSMKQQYATRIKDADDYEKQVLDSNRRTYQESLNNLITTLRDQTSAINENSPDVVNAWKSMASSSREQYQATLNSLPDDVRNVVIQMTGVTYDNTIAVASAWANMAAVSESEFTSKISNLPEDMQNQLLSLVKIINSNGGTITQEVEVLANNIISTLNKQGEAEVAGINVAIGYGQGLADEQAFQQALSNARNLAGSALGAMRAALDEHSPSKKAEQIGAYVPEGFVLGIKKGQSKAVKSVEDMSQELADALSWSDPLNKIDSSINRRITNATRTIFTTPNIQFNVQTLNKENLDLAFNYINKKFGSQY